MLKALQKLNLSAAILSVITITLWILTTILYPIKQVIDSRTYNALFVNMFNVIPVYASITVINVVIYLVIFILIIIIFILSFSNKASEIGNVKVMIFVNSGLIIFSQFFAWIPMISLSAMFIHIAITVMLFISSIELEDIIKQQTFKKTTTYKLAFTSTFFNFLIIYLLILIPLVFVTAFMGGEQNNSYYARFGSRIISPIEIFLLSLFPFLLFASWIIILIINTILYSIHSENKQLSSPKYNSLIILLLTFLMPFSFGILTVPAAILSLIQTSKLRKLNDVFVKTNQNNNKDAFQKVLA
ncbi:hypothetical protein ACXYRK_00855 [Mycoplasma sp. AC1221]